MSQSVLQPAQFSTWYHGTGSTEQGASIAANGLQSGLSTDDKPYMTLASHKDEAAMWAGKHGSIATIHVPESDRASHLTAPAGNLGFMGPARLSGIKQPLPASMVHKVENVEDW